MLVKGKSVEGKERRGKEGTGTCNYVLEQPISLSYIMMISLMNRYQVLVHEHDILHTDICLTYKHTVQIYMRQYS